MKFRRSWALWVLATPAFGQYAGPAILARGEAPAAMSSPQIDFRPFVELTGIYDNGLTGVVLNQQGQVGSSDSAGLMVVWGISGTHSWRHTKVGLNYRGSVTHYDKSNYYDSSEQSLLLGITHQFSPHTMLTLRESAGMFSQDYGTATALSQTVPFDPAASYIPTTDFFDNRTFYLTTQADFTVQKTARLSFNVGGDGTDVVRRSSALYGVVGGTARGDVQYRLTRRTTIGAMYNYQHFDFNRIQGGTDIHGIAGSYSTRLNRTVEFSGYLGFMRAESKFLQEVAVDPVIAALLGISAAPQIVHHITTTPNFSGRFSKTFVRGVVYVDGGHTVVPGNGLFLTSYGYNASAAYVYTGLRRWSFRTSAGFNRYTSTGPIGGRYGDYSGVLSASRQLTRATHFVAEVDARRYHSGDYSNYNRSRWTVRVGFGFTPGDVPLRIW